MTHRETLDVHPAPTAPRAGAPRFPKMKTQLKKTLARLAPTMVHTMGETRPMAWRL